MVFGLLFTLLVMVKRDINLFGLQGLLRSGLGSILAASSPIAARESGNPLLPGVWF